MPGRPIRRLMIAELERRAKDAGPEVTAIDIVCEWTAEGQTMADLARELTEATGQTISPGVIGSWVNSTKEGNTKITAARALAAHVLAEKTLGVFEELSGTEVTREEVALGKAKAEVMQWLASKWNRPQYGTEAASINVQINAGDAHLEALRRRAIQAKTQPLLPAVEGQDYETVPHDQV